jgi:hypothetical protein
MRLTISIFLLTLIHAAGSASAATKAYDSSIANGQPGDSILISTTLCPPVTTTEDNIFGFAILEDDNSGFVSLNVSLQGNGQVDLGPDQLNSILGPGAFFFLDSKTSLTNVPPGGTVHVSLAGSGTDPGETAVWGIISGWSATGSTFCRSSPVVICNQNNWAHGMTVTTFVASGTYNLNTWVFDAEGDYEAVTPYLLRSSNGGLTNNLSVLRGAFHGNSLPALPLVGAAALALSLAIVGGRALSGKK